MAIMLQRYKVEVTLVSPMLGTVGKDPDVYTNYVAAKKLQLEGEGLTEEELQAELDRLPDIEEVGWTSFRKTEDGKPFIYDYMIKGMFKEIAKFLRADTKSLSRGLTYYKDAIKGRIFVYPRQIVVEFEGELGVEERSLRAETAKGPRVALAKSDTAPREAKLHFELRVLQGSGKQAITEDLLREWLDYGLYTALGQWRSAGHGRVIYEMEHIGEIPLGEADDVALSW